MNEWTNLPSPVWEPQISHTSCGMKEDMKKYIQDITQDLKLELDKLHRAICDTSTYNSHWNSFGRFKNKKVA